MKVIQRARSVQLTVKDLSKLTPETKGQASEVFKIESQEGNHTVTKFFKKEDSMDMDTVKKKGKHDTSSDADVLKGMGISQEGIDAAKYMISCLIKMENIVDNGYVRHISIVASATVYDYKDARVFDAESGEMVVHYMDDELAQRIENLNSDMVRYVLVDLLKEEEIKAFIQRLDKMKEGIQKARKEHPERFLKSEDEWMSSHMIKSTAGEMFKDDPETLEAILLYEDDRAKFEETYQDKADQKSYFMTKRVL